MDEGELIGDKYNWEDNEQKNMVVELLKIVLKIY